VVEPLIALLHDEDWWVRERAVVALGNIRDHRAVQPLIALSKQPEMRWVVAMALGNFAGPEVEEALLSFAQDEQKMVRREASMALGKLKTDNAIAMLKKLLGDEEREIQSKAAEMLKQITGQNYPTGKSIITSEIPIHEVVTTYQEGAILSEAIVVMDICNSTSIAAKYGDNFALQITKNVVELINPLLRRYNVQYMKSTGDGYLLTFHTIESAINTAAEMLRKVKEYNTKVTEDKQVKLRFAINFGETRIDAKMDRLGVATNMTFRLDSIRREGLVELAAGVTRESIPLENRILISESVYEQLKEKGEGQRCTFLGYFEPRGILGRHKVFQLQWE
jgi:class 3 adenylate cyclase